MKTSQLFDQCVQVYEAMLEKSDDNTTYRGYLTYLFEDLGLGISRYTPVMRRLVAMECIKQTVAGGRGVPSEWKLITEPDMASFIKTASRRQRSRIQELEDRIARVEQELGMKAS